VEIQYKWPWDPLCVTVTSVDTVHSVIFTNGLRPLEPTSPSAKAMLAKGPGNQIMEGMWWKQGPQVTGFVALSNTTAQVIKAQLQVSDSTGQAIGQHAVTISAHGTKTLNLEELQAAAGTAGGLRVTCYGGANDLLPNGGLQDKASGYSASVPFVPLQTAPLRESTQTFAELGLMSGAADPMMQFPAGTTFTPYAFLRNAGEQSASVTPSIYWMESGAARSARLQAIKLLPHQTLSLDVPASLSLAGLQNFNGSFNLVFDVKGLVLLASGSVDQKNTYVFEVIPASVKESASKTLGRWSTANGDDTMVTLWNPADEAQDMLFTAHFSGGHYNLPVHLGPRATRMFNLSEIVQNQIPDPEGNLIPPSIHEGSAKISGLQAENEHILVAVGGGVYNVRKATCAYICTTCNGAVSSSFQSASFSVPYQGNTQLALTAQWNSGHVYDLSSVATWTSSNSSVATVSKGLTYGVAVGNITINGADVPEPWYYYDCGTHLLSCPQDTGVDGSGSGPVKPNLTRISPNFGKVGTNVGVTLSGSGFGTAPTVNFGGTGISVTYLTRNDTTIAATFTIAASAPVGIQTVSVNNTTTGDGGSPTSNPVNFQVTPASAVPVNFHLTGASDQGGGALPLLVADFAWQSSTGNYLDLGSCFVRENVTFPNTNNGTCPSSTQNCFFPSSPPWAAKGSAGSGYANPTITSPGTAAGAEQNSDYDTVANLNFVKPYSASPYSGSQLFQYSCNGGSWTTLYGPASINYSMSMNASNKWQAVVSRSDTPQTSVFVIPNQ
jgi:hypothetical protein